MTISIELFREWKNADGSVEKHCQGRAKVWFDGVFSQAIEYEGRHYHDSNCEFLITLRCPTCKYWEQKFCTINHVEVWDDTHKEYTDFTCDEFEIEQGECRRCAEIALNKCDLPCFDRSCDQHPDHYFEYYSGWTPGPDPDSDESEA